MSLFEPGGEVGRYKLLGRLATGGMAEIYLARQSGPSGFSKVVVLKVILPHLAQDANFMRMFTNEAKLAALLNHPSVVQVAMSTSLIPIVSQVDPQAQAPKVP